MGKRLYEDFGDETGLGYPILPRTERTMASGREALVKDRTIHCPICQGVVSVTTLFTGFCVACTLRLPEDQGGLRHQLQVAFRPGAREQSKTWQEAHQAARAYLEAGR